jgi:hypothetical protein
MRMDAAALVAVSLKVQAIPLYRRLFDSSSRISEISMSEMD